MSSPYVVQTFTTPPHPTSIKPSFNANKQQFIDQTLQSYRPILFTPNTILKSMSLVSLLCLSLGTYLLAAVAPQFHAITIVYDDPSRWQRTPINNKLYQPVPVNTTKIIRFTLDRDMTTPLYIHYELTNFYQQGRVMQHGRDNAQLSGHDPLHGVPNMDPTAINQETLNYFSNCNPLALHPDYRNTELCQWNETNARGVPCKIMWPCGLIPFSFFNDVFVSASDHISFRETNIARPEDQKNYRYSNPTVESAGWDYNDQVSKGASSNYYLLYQMYPKFPKLKEEGVRNEHFQIWMRSSGGFSTIRKLYAIIDRVDAGDEGAEGGSVLTKGSTVDVQVRSEYSVAEFNGAKSLRLSTNIHYQNVFNYGVVLLVVGCLMLLGVVLLVAATTQLPNRTIQCDNGGVFVVSKMD